MMARFPGLVLVALVAGVVMAARHLRARHATGVDAPLVMPGLFDG